MTRCCAGQGATSPMLHRQSRCTRWWCARRTPMPGSAFGDLARVRAMPGVRLVLTAADISALGPLPTPGVVPDVDIKIPHYPILAKDVVRHVGDAVAFVVADTLDAAKDAAEAIEIDWQPLPHVDRRRGRAQTRRAARSGQSGRTISRSRPRLATRAPPRRLSPRPRVLSN